MTKKQWAYALLLLTLPTLVVVVAMFVLMNWRLPTRIRAELTADRAVFTLGGTDSTPILNSVGFQSITIEKFAGIEFRPEKLAVADPTQYIHTASAYPESAWTSVTVTAPVGITGEDDTLQPAVTLESARTGLNTAGPFF